ncbi:SHOCT domain-containing protein [Hymenobacter tenuis]
MDKDPSPLDTLRQLKEWLDAGTITPQEFETLKKKLLFSEAAAAPTPAPPPAPVAPISPPTPPAPEAPSPPPAATPLIPPAIAGLEGSIPMTYIEPNPAPPVVPPVTPASPVIPPAPAPATKVGPVEDPMLPPVTTSRPLTAPYVAEPPTPPSNTPGLSHPLEAGRPRTSPSRDDEFIAPPTTAPIREVVEDEPYVAPTKSPLSTILIIGGILALLGLVAYLMLGDRESERLTSTSVTAADSLATRPEEGPQSEQIELAPAAAPETIRVAPVLPPSTTTRPDSASQPVTTPAPAATTEPATPAAPSPADESAAQARIEGVLKNYYADLQAAPFSAASYFAPQVERFYLQQNTTPAAINAELEKSHFPEFLEGQTAIEPGSLKVSPPVNDGSRVATFIEKSSALRQSMQKRQQTTAQVRVRFDKNFKIVYLRQERLLENTFTE